MGRINTQMCCIIMKSQLPLSTKMPPYSVLSMTDEDFASVKAPPSKKAREDVRQEQKKSSSKSSSEETNSRSTQSEKSRWVAPVCSGNGEASCQLRLSHNREKNSK